MTQHEFINRAAQDVTGIPAWNDIKLVPESLHFTGGAVDRGEKVTVYLSGPMSGYVGHNYPVFDKAAAHLRALGLEVISPAEMGYKEGWTWLDYIIRDLEGIRGCGGVVVLPRFEESAGALIEVMACRRMGHFLWRLDGDEWIGELRPDGSLDYESDDLELLGVSLPHDVTQLLEYVNAGTDEPEAHAWTVARSEAHQGWTFEQDVTGITVTLTDEFLEDNPTSQEPNLDRIGDIILQHASKADDAKV